MTTIKSMVASRLGRRPTTSPDDPSRPEHRTIVVVDIVGFGLRTDREQLLARSVLVDVVRRAFRLGGVRWTRLWISDRGDGMVVLVPPDLSKLAVLEAVLPALRHLVDRHNGRTADQIKLRVAVHAGEVQRDARGWVGTDLNLACRLVDDRALYRALLEDPQENVAVLISGPVHDVVLRFVPSAVVTYRAVRVVAKEVDTVAWLSTPSGTVDSKEGT
jgi:class 3 adenylate cyclase